MLGRVGYVDIVEVDVLVVFEIVLHVESFVVVADRYGEMSRVIDW